MPKKPKRSRLEKLQNSWAKSSARERSDFLRWLEEQDAGLSKVSSDVTPAPQPAGPIASGRYLTPATITRIKSVMAARGLSDGDVMEALGFSREDCSLRRALDDHASLRLLLVEALAIWLEDETRPAGSNPKDR
jgi:hypothetical protein